MPDGRSSVESWEWLESVKVREGGPTAYELGWDFSKGFSVS